MLSKIAKCGNRLSVLGRNRTNVYRILNRLESTDPLKTSSPKPISNPPPPPPPPPSQKQQTQQKKEKKRGFGKMLFWTFILGCGLVGSHFYLVNTYLDPYDEGNVDRIVGFQKKFGPVLKYIMADYVLSNPSDIPNWTVIYKELLSSTKSSNVAELEQKLTKFFGFPAKINPDRPETILGYSKNLPTSYFLAILNCKFGVKLVSNDLRANLMKMYQFCEDEKKNIELKTIVKLFQDVAGVSPKIGPSIIGSRIDKINRSNKVLVKLIINNLVSSIRPGEKPKVLSHLIDINTSLSLGRDRTDYGDNFVIQHAKIFQCFAGIDTLKRGIEKPSKPIPKEEPKKEIKKEPVHQTPTPISAPPTSPPAPVPHTPEPVKVTPVQIPTQPKVKPVGPKDQSEAVKPLPQLILSLFGMSKK